jgi:tetratricopeptide (TPR) repeat protein
MTVSASMIEQAISRLQAGKYREALQSVTSSNMHADDPGLLAQILSKIGMDAPELAVRLQATTLLCQVQPNNSALWKALSQLAYQAENFILACDAWAKAMKLTAKPVFADHIAMGRLEMQTNQIDAAAAQFEKALKLDPSHIEAHISLIGVHQTRGDIKSAHKVCQNALKLEPKNIRILALSIETDPKNAETARRLENLILSATGQDLVISNGAFALCKWYDKQKQPEQAMQFAEIANRISASIGQTQGHGYRPDQERQKNKLIVQVFDADFCQTPAGPKIEPSPIFIMGMPRSGTSILESLIAAHPDVHAGGERGHVLSMGDILLDIAAKHGVKAAQAQFVTSRKDWAQSLADYARRRDGITTPYFTDKLPINYKFAGLIADLLPDAPLIYVHRDPRDVCLSMYFLDFPKQYAYANDLQMLADEWVRHHQLIQQWKQILGERLLWLDYHQFVREPVEQGERIFNHCGLIWKPEYVESQNRQADMRTFSALQIRKPIQPSPPRWPAYRKWIGPLLDAFGDQEQARLPD